MDILQQKDVRIFVFLFHSIPHTCEFIFGCRLDAAASRAVMNALFAFLMAVYARF
jgi:hypothetical protein